MKKLDIKSMSKETYVRRQFLELGMFVLLTSVAGPFYFLSKDRSGFRFKIKANGREVGIMISKDAKGRLIFSARQIGVDRLFIVQFPKPKMGRSKGTHSQEFTQKDGSSFRVSIDQRGKLSSDLKAVYFSSVTTDQPNRPSSEGFFNWLGNLVSDALKGIGAALTWMIGGACLYKFSWGGSLAVDSNGGIVYRSGSFRLEPGMEEDPGVWY